MTRLLSLLISLFLVSSLSAQDPSTIFHRTFDLKEVNGISLTTHENDSVRIERWVGNQLLIETNIKLLNGKKPLLKHFLEKGRWALDTLLSGDQLQFAAHDPVRNVLTNAGTEVIDVVTIVIYMPDDFEPSGQYAWIRKEEE